LEGIKALYQETFNEEWDLDLVAILDKLDHLDRDEEELCEGKDEELRIRVTEEIERLALLGEVGRVGKPVLDKYLIIYKQLVLMADKVEESAINLRNQHAIPSLPPINLPPTPSPRYTKLYFSYLFHHS
jgi:hypothetical protein